MKENTIKIMITGPQGIGKTTLATIIHEHLTALSLKASSEEPLDSGRPLFRLADFIRKVEIEIETTNEELAPVRPETAIEAYPTQCDFSDQWEELDFHLEDAEDQAARAYQETNDNDRAEYTANTEEALQAAALIIDRLLFTIEQGGALPSARCGSCFGCAAEKEIHADE